MCLCDWLNRSQRCVARAIIDQGDFSEFSTVSESLAPSTCTTIEEVGSTGVGALTITFLILSVTLIPL